MSDIKDKCLGNLQVFDKNTVRLSRDIPVKFSLNRKFSLNSNVFTKFSEHHPKVMFSTIEMSVRNKIPLCYWL